MAKPLDVTPHVAQPAAADDNSVHNVFIADILDSDDKKKPQVETDKNSLTPKATADGTATLPLRPASSTTGLFHLSYGDVPARGKPTFDAAGRIRANISDFTVRPGARPEVGNSALIRSVPSAAQTPLIGGRSLYGQPESSHVRSALRAYQSPFGVKPVSYLDLDHPIGSKRPVRPAADVAATAQIQAPNQDVKPKVEVNNLATVPARERPSVVQAEYVTDVVPQAKSETSPGAGGASADADDKTVTDQDGKPVVTDDKKANDKVEKSVTPEVAPAPKPASVTSADGKSVYECTESGAWQSKDKFNQIKTEHVDFAGKKIVNVEAQPDGSVKVTIEGGKIVRELPGGGRVHYTDEDAFKANHPCEIVGKSKDIVWDGDKVKSFYSQSTKTRWHQVADDVWSNDPNARTGWSGHIEYDGVKGTFKRTTLGNVADKGVRDEARANGINEQFSPNGSMQFEVPYPEGMKVTFKFKESFADGKNVLTQPEELKITDKSNTETVWKKVGPNEYVSGGGSKWKVEIEVKRDGTYSYKDLESGERVVRTKAGGYEKESPKDNTLIVKEDGKFTRAKVGDDDLRISYGADGKPSEIQHINKNIRLVRAPDGSWNDAAIDGGKPFTKLAKFEMDMYTHSELDPIQKIRMSDNVAQFRASTKFTNAQKDLTFKEADRLLNGRQDSVMTSAEKANYADQLFWHVVNDKRNEQGNNSTCSVTALRGIGYKEQPWVVAKLAADLSNDGQMVVLDGSTIKPKLDSMRVRPGSPEDSFPPKPPNRDALGKLWDVGTVNISMQRDTKDPFGVVIAKGTLSFEEVAPTGRSDCGARIVKLNADGSESVLYSNKNGNSTPYDSPRVGYPSRIADIWHQLTGEKLTDRFLVHDNRWVDDSAVFKQLVGQKQKSEQEVENVLKSNSLAKVTQGNTGMLELRYKQQQAINEGKDPSKITKPAGGEHLFLVTGYDAPSKTVSIDNSWNTPYDMLNEAEAKAAGKDLKKTIFISLSDLYDVMSTQSAGDGSTISWVKR